MLNSMGTGSASIVDWGPDAITKIAQQVLVDLESFVNETGDLEDGESPPSYMGVTLDELRLILDTSIRRHVDSFEYASSKLALLSTNSTKVQRRNYSQAGIKPARKIVNGICVEDEQEFCTLDDMQRLFMAKQDAFARLKIGSREDIESAKPYDDMDDHSRNWTSHRIQHRSNETADHSVLELESCSSSRRSAFFLDERPASQNHALEHDLPQRSKVAQKRETETREAAAQTSKHTNNDIGCSPVIFSEHGAQVKDIYESPSAASSARSVHVGSDNDKNSEQRLKPSSPETLAQRRECPPSETSWILDSSISLPLAVGLSPKSRSSSVQSEESQRSSNTKNRWEDVRVNELRDTPDSQIRSRSFLPSHITLQDAQLEWELDLSNFNI